MPLVLSLVCAAVVLTGGVQESSSRARDLAARAQQLDEQGNRAGALPLLWEAAALEPEDPDLQNRLGEALEAIGALDAAIEAFERALSRRPAFHKAANNLVLTLVKAGRGHEAAERARRLVEASPGEAEAHFTLGLALAEQDVEAAIHSFRRVLELAPQHALARYNLALVLKRADRFDEAVAELTRALGTERRAEAHYTLGVIHWQQGDLDRALRALRDAVAADPRYAEAHYTLGAVLRARGDLGAAEEALQRALALRPGFWSAHYTLGQVLQAAGDEGGAHRHLERAEALREAARLQQEAGVWTAVGTARLDAGDLLGALDLFRRATTVLETYAPAHYQMGRTLRRLGEEQAARSAFARAHRLDPSLVPPEPAR